MQELSGREFDRAYLDAQVQVHQLAIDTVQNRLLTAARDARLRRLLTETTPALRQHLQEAQASLESRSRGWLDPAGTALLCPPPASPFIATGGSLLAIDRLCRHTLRLMSALAASALVLLDP